MKTVCIFFAMLLLCSVCHGIEIVDTFGKLKITLDTQPVEGRCGLVTGISYNGIALPIAPSQTLIAGGNRWPVEAKVDSSPDKSTLITYKFRDQSRCTMLFIPADGYIHISIGVPFEDELQTAIIWKIGVPKSPLNANGDVMAQHAGGDMFVGVYPLNAETYRTTAIDDAYNGVLVISPRNIPRTQCFAFFAYPMHEHDALLARIEKDTGHPPLTQLFHSPENSLDTLFLHPKAGQPVNLDGNKICDYMDDPAGDGVNGGGYNRLILLHWLWCDAKNKDIPFAPYGWQNKSQWDVGKFITQCKARGKTVILHTSPEYVLPGSYFPQKYPVSGEFVSWDQADIVDAETAGEVFTRNIPMLEKMGACLATRMEQLQAEGYFTDHCTGTYQQALVHYAQWKQFTQDNYWSRLKYITTQGTLRYLDSTNLALDFWEVRPNMNNMTLPEYYARLKKEAIAWRLFRGVPGRPLPIDFGWNQPYSLVVPDMTQSHGYRTRPMLPSEFSLYLDTAIEANFPLCVKVHTGNLEDMRRDGWGKQVEDAIRARDSGPAAIIARRIVNGDTSADYNGDGKVNGLDIQVYLDGVR